MGCNDHGATDTDYGFRVHNKPVLTEIPCKPYMMKRKSYINLKIEEFYTSLISGSRPCLYLV